MITCPCMSTVIWTRDVDDGSDKFELVEGVGDTQPCCDGKRDEKAEKTDNVVDFETAMRGVQKRKKGMKRAK